MKWLEEAIFMKNHLIGATPYVFPKHWTMQIQSAETIFLDLFIADMWNKKRMKAVS